jgi:hypothetical protein
MQLKLMQRSLGMLLIAGAIGGLPKDSQKLWSWRSCWRAQSAACGLYGLNEQTWSYLRE